MVQCDVPASGTPGTLPLLVDPAAAAAEAVVGGWRYVAAEGDQSEAEANGDL